MELFEELTIFEQRILCHKLPNSFDSIDIDLNPQQCANKRNKVIQEIKRQMLNVRIEEYESKIQHYEHLYQQEFDALQLQILNPSSSPKKCQTDILLYFVKLYLNHVTNRHMRQIRYKESCLHIKLMRQSRHDRHHPSSKKKTINVYPQIIVDVPKVSLNRTQLDYLSHNGKLNIPLIQYYIKRKYDILISFC